MRTARSILLSAVLAAVAGAGPADDRIPEGVPRDAAMAQERDRLQAELDALGGWTAWHEKLEPFLDAADQIAATQKAEGRDYYFAADGQMFLVPALEELVREARAVGESGGGCVRDWSSVAAVKDLVAQLGAWGIDLIVAPVPSKPQVYPESLSKVLPPGVPVTLARHAFLLALLDAGIEVLDFFPALRAARDAGPHPLYLPCDIHWSDRGVRIAADAIAPRVARYPEVRTRTAVGYVRKPERRQMLNHFLPPDVAREHGPFEDYAEPVFDFRDMRVRNYEGSPVVVLGDSFAEGNVGGGSLNAHLSYAIARPVSGRYALGSGPLGPRLLARKGAAYLEGRRVVVWAMLAGALAQPWETAVLPKPGPQAAQKPHAE